MTISYLDPQRPTIVKDPASELDYGFDWTEWLAEQGRQIVTATVSAAGGVSATPATHDGAIVATKVSGGTAGTEAVLTCRIVTDGSPALTDERSIWLRIVER